MYERRFWTSEYSMNNKPVLSIPGQCFEKMLLWPAFTLCLLLLASCSPSRPPLNVAISAWQGYQPLYIAVQKNLIAPETINLLNLPTNASSLRALNTGLAEVAALTLDEAIRAKHGGFDLKVIMVFNRSAGADKVIAKAPITDVGELRSKRIGIDKPTYATLLLATALESQEMKLKDVELINMPVSEQVANWKAGKIDAAVTYSPTADQLLRLGGVNVFDTSSSKDIIVDVLVVRADTAADRPEDVAAVVNSFFAGLTFFKENPETAAFLIAPNLSITPEEVMGTYDGLEFADKALNKQLFAAADTPLIRDAHVIQNYLMEIGVLSENLELDSIFDPSFIQ